MLRFVFASQPCLARRQRQPIRRITREHASPQSGAIAIGVRITRPASRCIKGVNWGGLKTLYIKEVRRFFKVQLQTVWAPAITTLLFLVDLHGRDWAEAAGTGRWAIVRSPISSRPA